MAKDEFTKLREEARAFVHKASDAGVNTAVLCSSVLADKDVCMIHADVVSVVAFIVRLAESVSEDTHIPVEEVFKKTIKIYKSYSREKEKNSK